ncbi:phage holin family protein [Trinickia sp. LjRoot230]|uniref:phage holin family protein n=1 Tax=Trinickia sp. LjRoot230 TaxID=3342288 RepID=UPI003ECE00B5
MPNDDTQSPRSASHQHGPFRRMFSSLMALLHTRLELIGIELAEERERLLAVLFLGLIAVMFAMMALISLTALVAVAFWDTYRWQTLAGITAVYGIGALICALKARSGLREAPIVFQQTLNEFEKDREMFRQP